MGTLDPETAFQIGRVVHELDEVGRGLTFAELWSRTGLDARELGEVLRIAVERDFIRYEAGTYSSRPPPMP